MPARPRFVFDTHAVISAALLKQSVSRKALDKALAEGEATVRMKALTSVESDAVEISYPVFVNGILKTESWISSWKPLTRKCQKCPLTSTSKAVTYQGQCCAE